MNVDELHNARRLSCSQCPTGHYTKGDKVYAKCVVCDHEVTYGDFELDEPQERITFADDGFLYVYDVQYVATINTPGYLPWDDDPPTFDTPREAWDYLLDRRRELEDQAVEMDLGLMVHSSGGDPHQRRDDCEAEGCYEAGYSATFNTIERCAQSGTESDFQNADLNPDGTGSIFADDPTYDGDHPLGLVYSVTEVEELMAWRTVHPANVKVGDVTPAGVVEEVELFGNLAGGLAAIRIAGIDYTRSYLPSGWVDIKED